MSKSIYTFWELLNECPIVIPQVQRDYAYGRNEAKAKDVLDKILTSIHDVLLPADLESAKMAPLTMDFIYGNRDEIVGLNPLDGQQRLTTLFLLHLYASIMDGEAEGRKLLKRFCYETRQSANNFCKSLIEDYSYKTDFKKHPLSAQIVDSPKYLASYKEDPTIMSMLVVLDKIVEKFSDVENLWQKLTEQRRIIFYFLPLDKFGLSDDLYIKMNSRGKALTNYELYKSDFIEFLDKNYPKFKKGFSDKLDGKWTDMIWRNAGNDTKTSKDVSSVDEGLMNMFSNFSVLLYHLRTGDNFSSDKGKDVAYLSSPHKNQFLNEKEVRTLYQMFVTVENALNGENVNQYWNDVFYLNDTVLSEKSERIRLFWPQKESIFVLTFRHRLSRAQMIFFYAVYLSILKGLDKDTFIRRMRHLRNLVINSEYQLRGANLHGMLIDTEAYINNGTFPSADYFNSIQVEEEQEKDLLSSWPELWRYENHFILRGSIALFLKTNAIDLLKKFYGLFAEKYFDNTEKLRLALLVAGEGGSDYMQYQASMQNENFKQRWFVCRPDMWPYFFTWNQQRHNQEAIIECLRHIPDSIEGFDEYIKDGLSRLSTKSWKYYMVRYPGNWNTIKDNSQGVYHWDDQENKPLEVIMLNSSTHSSNLLEWNILNLTLRYAFSEGVCALDPHGHAKVQLLRANSFIDANQLGWTISTYEGSYLFEDLKKIKASDSERLKYQTSEHGVSSEEMSSIMVIVPDGIDYITFGIELVKDIERVYDNHHKDDIIPEDSTVLEEPELS